MWNKKKGESAWRKRPGLMRLLASAQKGEFRSTATGRLLRTIMLAVAEVGLENIREFITDAVFE